MLMMMIKWTTIPITTMTTIFTLFMCRNTFMLVPTLIIGKFTAIMGPIFTLFIVFVIVVFVIVILNVGGLTVGVFTVGKA